MKFLVLLVALCAGLLVEGRWIKDNSEESPEGDAMLGCIISEGLLNYSETIGDILQRDQYPIDNEKFNKFFGCYYKARGLIDENGNLQFENIKTFFQTTFAEGGKVKQMHKLIAQVAVDECRDTQGNDYKQKAVKMQNCILGFLKQVAED